MRYIGFAIMVAAASVNGVQAQRVSREDIPKYIKQLKIVVGCDRASVLPRRKSQKRGAISVRDVKDAIPVLKMALQKDKAEGVRAASAKALGTIGANAKETIPVLMKSLKDKSLTVNLAAIFGDYRIWGTGQSRDSCDAQIHA